MNLNSDLGEGSEEEKAILKCIDSANVGCGVHAGSPTNTIATALRCQNLGLQVGAHPGYDDRPNFGRKELRVPPHEIELLVSFQVASLAAIVPIAYIKPHGALYHRCQRDSAAADALIRVARKFGIGVMGQPEFHIVEAARRAGVPAYREGFADRRMLPDGSLAPREQGDAMLDASQAAQQAVTLARSGRYDTICVHGDTKGAGQVAAAVRQALRDAGIETARLGS